MGALGGFLLLNGFDDGNEAVLLFNCWSRNLKRPYLPEVESWLYLTVLHLADLNLATTFERKESGYKLRHQLGA